MTNPDPGTFSETTVAAFGSDDEPTTFTVTRFAKPSPDGPARTTPVLADDQMRAIVDVTGGVERAYCAANRDYYGADCDVGHRRQRRSRSRSTWS